MKKTTILITSILLILSFAACSSPAVQEDAAQQTETASPTLAPTAQPTAAPTPTPEPSPTPEPTLSPEELAEQQAMEEAEQLKHYLETYEDRYALFLIYEMIENGNIPEDFLEGIDQLGYDSIEKGSKDFYYQKMEFEKYELILNGRGEDLVGGQLESVLNGLYYTSETGSIFLSAFDTQESRDRVENGIEILNEWFLNPTEDNLIKTEELLHSNELLPGEYYALFTWFSFAPNHFEEIRKNGQIYSLREFCSLEDDKYSISIYEEMAANYYALLELNQTPNDPSYVPRDWLTPEKIQQLLSES